MKSFFLGALGAILVLVAAALIYPQYSDYRAAAETSGWLAEVLPTTQAITDNTLRLNTTTGAGFGIPKPTFQSHTPSLIEVTANGTVFLKGGTDGQIIVLYPELSGGKVVWRCRGGSHVTRACDYWRGP